MRTLDEIMAMKDLTKLTPIEICIRYSNVKGKALMKDEAQKAVAEYAALVGRVKIGHEEKVSTFGLDRIKSCISLQEWRL